MRALSLVVCIFLSMTMFSQEMPSMKAGSNRIDITSLNIKVEVIGNITELEV